ncbi:MAG: hypothetical protein ACO1O1_05705 [Adhaeribacter sp.]
MLVIPGLKPIFQFKPGSLHFYRNYVPQFLPAQRGDQILFCGYFLMVFGSLKTVALFGLLTAIAIAAAHFGELIIFPILLERFDRKKKGNFQSNEGTIWKTPKSRFGKPEQEYIFLKVGHPIQKITTRDILYLQRELLQKIERIDLVIKGKGTSGRNAPLPGPAR